MAPLLSSEIVSTAQCQVTVGPIALYCNFFYRSVMVVIVGVVVVVAVSVNLVAVVVFGEGRPTNGSLSPCHPPNGKNARVGV